MGCAACSSRAHEEEGGREMKERGAKNNMYHRKKSVFKAKYFFTYYIAPRHYRDTCFYHARAALCASLASIRSGLVYASNRQDG